MGWWKLEAWKGTIKGTEAELTDEDKEHIAEQIKQGYTQGEIIDE